MRRLLLALALAAGFPVRAVDADPVTACESALGEQGDLPELSLACAGLYSRPGCRAALLATDDPASHARRILDECAKDYCALLRPPGPAACTLLEDAGVRVASLSQVAPLWHELQAEIISREHGELALVRLALASGGSQRSALAEGAIPMALPPTVPESSDVRLRTPGRRFRVEILATGVVLYAGSRPVGPGCALGVAGVTFPLPAGGDDVEALRLCAARVKREVPSLGSEVEVFVEREVIVRRVKRVLSALRADARGESLFPNVYFNVLQADRP